jgi:hypothetical protein
VPHVEMSVSEPSAVRRPLVESSLDRWGEVASGASEPCLVIDARATIVALSSAAAELLGFGGDAVGRSLFDGVPRLLDFSSDRGELGDGEVGKIPPLFAMSSQRLSRGLLRVERDGLTTTLDAIATPLFDDGRLAGSLTFFSRV